MSCVACHKHLNDWLTCLAAAGSFAAVDLDELETASHYVKYAVAAYAIIPVTENPNKK